MNVLISILVFLIPDSIVLYVVINALFNLNKIVSPGVVVTDRVSFELKIYELNHSFRPGSICSYVFSQRKSNHQMRK